MPNFLIIGAAKSGTTALYYYLKQHPQIYMSPIKEPHFFAFEGEKLNFRGPWDTQEQFNLVSITNLETYRLQFQGVSNQVAIGEASALNLYIPKAPERIQHYIPDAKLIAILRNPVERAYSAFTFLNREGREPLTDFAQALEAEENRIGHNWVPLYYYQQLGFYYAQLKRYLDIFGQDQVKVYLYEDLNTSSATMLRDIFRFLSVDDSFVPDMDLRHNVSGIPKNKALNTFLRTRYPLKSILKPLFSERLRRRLVVTLQNLNLEKPPSLSPKLRRKLVEVYREDTLKLQDLIQRDLSQWLK